MHFYGSEAIPEIGFDFSRFAFLTESACHSGVSVRGFSGPTDKGKKKVLTCFNSVLIKLDNKMLEP